MRTPETRREPDAGEMSGENNQLSWLAHRQGVTAGETALLGLAMKEIGMDTIEGNDAEWLQFMRDMAIVISNARGMVSTDELRQHVESIGQPKSDHSWGCIFRGPQWKEIGRKRSTVPSNRGREIRIWQYVELV